MRNAKVEMGNRNLPVNFAFHISHFELRNP